METSFQSGLTQASQGVKDLHKKSAQVSNVTVFLFRFFMLCGVCMSVCCVFDVFCVFVDVFVLPIIRKRM